MIFNVNNITLNSCLNFILTTTFGLNWNVMVMTNHSLSAMGIKLNRPYFLTNRNSFYTEYLLVERQFKDSVTIDAYVFIEENTTTAMRTMTDVYRMRNWSRNALFVIYLINSFQTSQQDGFLDVLKKLFVVKVIVIGGSNDREMFRVAQNVRGECLYFLEFKADSCTESWERRFNSKIPPETFKSCTITAAGRIYDPFLIINETKSFADMLDVRRAGCVIATARVLFAKYNWSMTYRPYVDFCNYPSFFDVEVFDGRGSYMCLIPVGVNAFSYLNTHLSAMWTNPFVIMVLEPQKIPEWRIIFLIFDGYVWMLHFLSLLITVIIWSVRRKASFDRCTSTFFQVFLINLAFPSTIRSELLSTRCSLFATLVFALFFTNLFLARYTDLMAKPPLDERIDTFEQLAKRNVTLFLEHAQHLATIPDNYARELTIKLRGNISLHEIFGNNTNNAYLYFEHKMRAFRRERLRGPGPDLEYMSEYKFTLPTTISLFVKDHPLRAELNTRVARLLSAGFIWKFFNDAQTPLAHVQDSLDFEAWSLDNFNSAISLGCAGLAIAGVVLVVEIFLALFMGS